jgi:phosphate transport system substrate-binding protein
VAFVYPVGFFQFVWCLTIVVGAGATVAPASAQFWRSTEEIVISLNGENEVGTKMALGLATAYARQLKLGNVRVEPGTDADQYDVIGEGFDRYKKLRVKVRAKGHAFGLESLLRGQTDFWMAARQVSESDLEAMRKKGVPGVPMAAQLIQPGIENVVALSAVTVIVQAQNPVPALTYQQLRDIFAGNTTNWDQVGGPPNLPIGIYSPEPSMATADIFCAVALGNRDTLKCLDAFPRLAAQRILLMEDLSDAVAANPAGIGFIDFAARRSARLVALGTECGVGIEPSLFEIKTNEYPLTRRHYFYSLPGRALSPAAKEFLQLTLGPAGQAVAEAAGLANLTPDLAGPEYTGERIEGVRNTMDGGRIRVRTADARAFETAAAGADRLTITFRFQTGTNKLDSRAEADIVRLTELMRQPRYSQSQLALIGFSAAAGDYNDIRTLSKERADAVRDRLVAAGVKNVSSIGVGPAGAAVCNLDPDTSTLNQRVEVWVQRAPAR